MRTFALGLLFASALLVGASREASAQQSLGLTPRVGYIFEDGLGLFIGIGGRLPVGPVTFDPSVDYLFIDGGGTYLQIDGNLLYHLMLQEGGSFAPYLGAGGAFLYYDNESASSSSFGVNGLAGVEFPGTLGFATPFVQGRFTFLPKQDGATESSSYFSVVGGLVISLNNLGN